jgi:hypothetical protein
MLCLNRLPRARAAFAVLGAAWLLTACGGGFYYEDSDDVPPEVSVAAPPEARAGAAVRLTAAAVDDWSGVYQVGFYRLDGNVAILLGTDRSRPYEWTMTVPSDGRTHVDVFAWAEDRDGNEADSSVVRIAIVP